MIDSAEEYFLSSARRNVVAGILLDWSMRTASASFLVTEHSIHEPRSGMTRQPCSGRSPSCTSTRKSTPGGLDVFLKEALVSLSLDVDQVRTRQRIAALAEITGFTISHQISLSGG